MTQRCANAVRIGRRVAAGVLLCGLSGYACAQALAAGIPQVIMPMSFDQPDNAARLLKLGVARVVPAAKFTGATLSAALRDLFGDATVPKACADLAARMRSCDPLTAACDEIEKLRGRDVPVPK